MKMLRWAETNNQQLKWDWFTCIIQWFHTQESCFAAYKVINDFFMTIDHCFTS